MRTLVGLLCVLLVGCATVAPKAAPTTKIVAAAAPSPTPTPSPVPLVERANVPSVEAGLRQANELLLTHRLDDARALLAALRARATSSTLLDVVYLQATERGERGDLDGMAQLFTEQLDPAHRARDYGAEAMLHNALTWVAWALDDYRTALDENEACSRVTEAAPLPGATKRSLLLHYWWDRAYLELDVALRTHDPDALARAEGARRAFKKIGNQPDNRDSAHVLDAYFSARTGDGPAALKAARAVNVANDGDIQDLYCLQLALDAGGDAQAAAAVRQRIRQSRSDYPMRPLIIRQLDRDAGRADPR